MILWLLTLALPGFGQKDMLTHHMTEAEKALMPSYLQSQSLMKALAAPPSGVIRNIAEFEPMEGVVIAYPLGITTAIVREMAEDVMVYTIVSGTSQENQARNDYSSAGVNLDNCSFIHAGSDSYWTRDYGPWFVADENGSINIVDFTYNRPREQDNQIPSVVAGYLGIQSYLMDLVHCGGNYMTDGMGISISTDLVWDENSSKTHTQINQEVENYLGVQTYHVTDDPLGEYIKHIDCWGKLLDVDKILIGEVPVSHAQYDEFEAIVAYFEGQTTSYGNNYEVFRVYAPAGQPYTNSLILNKKVLVPITGSTDDAAAISSYEQAMPGYEVIGFTGSWENTDALHCRAKGIADRNALYISHLPLLGEKPVLNEYEISADIIPYSGQPVDAGSVIIEYRVDGGSFAEIQMSNTSGNTYTGNIPGQSQGSQIEYLISASDQSGQANSHPYIGEAEPHLFMAGQPLPDKPDAQFIADNTDILINSTAQFMDQSTNFPTSWSWTFEGGTPATSTEKNPLVTYFNAGTFAVTLQVSNVTGSDTKTIDNYIMVSETPYCESQGNDVQYEWVAGVSVGPLNNTSGASEYTDFTTITAELAAGADVNLSLTPGFSSDSYTEYWKIWIDYNGDRDFEDDGEEVFSSSGNSTVSGSFTVLEIPGSINTRMRVSMKYESYPGPCSSFEYGEVEDYSVTISTPIVPPTAEFSFVTDELNVDFTDQSSSGDNIIVSWQWNFGDGSPTSSEQDPSYTYSANGTYNVTLEVTDAADQANSISKPVTVAIFVPDYDPPAPDPMTWATAPHATGPNSIAMTATAATDQSGVEYLFECTAGGGNSSTWQDSPVYEDVGLDPQTQYTYRVKARDKSSNQNETDFSAAASATTPENLATLGNTQVFSSSTTTASRRAMPYTMPEDGTISSITMHHTAGSGKMILGLYDGEQLPENMLGTTEQTDVAGNTDWQTIDLSEPVFVQAGTKIWLAWVYENNPGIYYESGSPGRASSSESWSGGMPDPFGTSSTSNYIYSIYATYAPGTAPLLPDADFSFTITDLNVDFTDESSPGDYPIVSWQWDFGDASPTSSDQDPDYTYSANGTYNVTLEVTDAADQTNSISKPVTVEIIVPDYDPPAPNPMTWAVSPHATSPNSMSMTATTASDLNGVEYLFECTAGGGNNSFWQDSPVYEDIGLAPETQYTYRVKARDKSSNQNETDFSAAASATTPENLSTFGNTQVLSQSTTTASRRAMPYTMPEDGTISSITMYHGDGSGKMILGLYAGEQLPETRLGTTEQTDVASSTDWQTISLSEPVFVQAGTKIWLAWVYENNPGIYYESGSPGRASSSESWSGGMPDPFGTSSTSDYIYSIYATYTPGLAPALPNADFSYTITDLSVDFIDLSTPGEGNIVDWQWNFGDGATSTQQNPSHVYTEDKTYTITLMVTNSENNSNLESKQLVVGNPPVPYCTSEGTDVSYEWIAQVDIKDFSNVSDAQGYTDFTSMTIEMTAGQSYATTLTPGFASDAYSEYWKIWIDLNKDGDFDDTGEEVFSSSGNSAVSGNITLSSSLDEITTRMRVSMKYNASATSCETFTYGEVEDYIVHISK